jgi:hypothetical protein
VEAHHPAIHQSIQSHSTHELKPMNTLQPRPESCESQEITFIPIAHHPSPTATPTRLTDKTPPKQPVQNSLTDSCLARPPAQEPAIPSPLALPTRPPSVCGIARWCDSPPGQTLSASGAGPIGGRLGVLDVCARFSRGCACYGGVKF